MTREEARNRFRDIVAEAIDLSNGGLSPEAMGTAIADVLSTAHRTLQQQFVGGMKVAIHKYAATSTDLRNEAAVKWAKEVAALPNSDLRFPMH
jgi:hypothetical protein